MTKNPKQNAQQTTIVCQIGQPTSFSSNYYSAISTTIVTVRSGQELMQELTMVRPIGVLLLMSDPGSLKNAPWLQKLENKILFEGLRAVMALQYDPQNHAKLFSSQHEGQAHLVQCLGMRDFILLKDELTEHDLLQIVHRIRFSFGLEDQSPFAGHFRLEARHSEPLEVSLPGRISHLDNEMHACVETAISLLPGTRVKVRLMGMQDGPRDVAAEVQENLPSALRFNYGNSVRFLINSQDRKAVQDLLAEESPALLLSRPVRRAMVLTRNIALRQRILPHMLRNHIECRVPLVRRNIKGDLPPLRPEFLIIEPKALSASSGREASEEIETFLQLAGPQCHAIVVGKSDSWVIAPSHRINVISDDANLEEALSQCLSFDSETGHSSQPKKSTWFSTESKRSKVMVVLREHAQCLANGGVVFRTQQTYRIWSNCEVRGLESKLHLIGRISSTRSLQDTFRLKLKLGPAQQPLQEVSVASVAGNSLLRKAFQGAVQKSFEQAVLDELADAAFVKRQLARILQAEEEKNKARHLKKTAAETPLPLALPTPRKRRRKSDWKVQKPKGPTIALISIFLLVIVGVAYGILTRGSDSTIYGESFRSLFEAKKVNPAPSQKRER